ncbi:hypothetical protein GIB67_021288 [Kingdonia uniflora]|uniref:AB hydrolase-1 domain-containing protein n=1 Tax=Kingdonia uniflora TaxID=39325 RepID=A0A7J7P9F5_9MAGN|nr:hypothetical protein GIB67_021288 [Kingdonia uniflora]
MHPFVPRLHSFSHSRRSCCAHRVTWTGPSVVVGHDWGAMMAWYLCLIRPDIVKAMVSLSVPYFRRNPSMKFVEGFRVFCGDDYYICRFQEPGEMEEEFAQVDTPKLMTKFLTIREPDLLMLPKNTWMAGMPKVSVTLPTWLTEEDINYYASKFEKKGFTGGLNYYRAVDLNWELTAAWTNAKVQVPAKFITGDLDLVYHMPGMKDYIHSPEGLKKDVPLLEEIVIMEDVAHFINQEKGDEISKHIYNFIKKF